MKKDIFQPILYTTYFGLFCACKPDFDPNIIIFYRLRTHNSRLLNGT